ncbi:MAG: type III-A CRISPR-associated protein Csm2 [Candidatus Heimdallarchaeaceae archaeon]
MSYGRGSYKKPQTRHSSKKAQREYPPEVKKIWEKLSKISRWAEYSFVDIAKENGDAYLIAQEIKNDRKPEPSQLRKYYDEVLRGGILLKKLDPDIEKARRIIAMLNPRIKYAYSRGLVGDTLVEFIKLATSETKFSKNAEEFKKDYERFQSFFEALIGYFTYLKEKR